MKKKCAIIGVIVVIAAIVCILFATRTTVLGSMNLVYAEPTTSISTVSFWGDEGDKIKFSFASEIKSGNLDIVLYDSDGEVVYKLAKADKLETFFVLEHSGSYTLAAEYTDFVGNFKIKVLERVVKAFDKFWRCSVL